MKIFLLKLFSKTVFRDVKWCFNASCDYLVKVSEGLFIAPSGYQCYGLLYLSSTLSQGKCGSHYAQGYQATHIIMSHYKLNDQLLGMYKVRFNMMLMCLFSINKMCLYCLNCGINTKVVKDYSVVFFIFFDDYFRPEWLTGVSEWVTEWRSEWVSEWLIG